MVKLGSPQAQSFLREKINMSLRGLRGYEQNIQLIAVGILLAQPLTQALPFLKLEDLATHGATKNAQLHAANKGY